MRRKLEKCLLEWKDAPSHKPILLRGARQVGKSWLVQNLGTTFDTFVEINFEETPALIEIFSNSLNPEITVPLISNITGKDIIPGKTLLFLDEIQLCPNAIIALRYFYEKIPDLHVIAAGSLVEFELEKVSTPVGRIEFLYVHPLSFSEYLVVLGKEKLLKLVELQDLKIPIPQILHDELLNHVRDYTLIGGMPEIVREFIKTKDLKRCQKIQSNIISTYKSDFKKYSKKHELKYIDIVFNAIPFQIGGKLKYSNISKDIRSREIINALNLLEKAGLIYKVYHSSCNGLPLEAEIDLKKFKILFFDIGLTNSLLGTDLKNFLLNPDIAQINNGTIAETFVGLELKAYQSVHSEKQLHYWLREKKQSNAEVDYVFQKSDNIIPIEVKSGSTGTLKSLHIFLEEKNRHFGIKISKSNFSVTDKLQSIPFYAIEKLVKSEF